MLFALPPGLQLRCPKCGVKITRIAANKHRPIEFVDGSLSFCLDCGNPLRYHKEKHQMVLLTHLEIFEVVMSEDGESWMQMWSQIMAAIRMGREVVGLPT